MRRILVVALVLLAAPAQAYQAPIGQTGRWFTDAHGKVVVLHGLNMVAKRPPYAPDALGFSDDDARFLARNGFNTVRLGVIYAAVEPTRGVYDDRYLARIAQTVRTLARDGILTTLDFHQDLFNERFQGEGWPDWAVMDDGLPAQPQSGFPGNYLAMPALNRAFDHLWANDGGLQDAYAAAWAHVARAFARSSHVVGFDLLNEPWPGTAYAACLVPTGCPGFDATLSGLYARVREAIGATSKLLIYEPDVLFNYGVASGVRGGQVFSFHDYCLTAGVQGACDAFDDLVFRNAMDHVGTGEVPLLTEFGATQDPTVLGPMADRADANMVGWQEWHYCGCDDPTTSGPGDAQALVLDPARPPRGDNVEAGKLALLARPYPRTVAGTPTGWSFANGTAEAAWTTARASGRGRFRRGSVSELAMPRVQFPAGYRVEVSGARVISAPGATSLRVATCPGARAVAITVRGGLRPLQSSRECPRLPSLSVRDVPPRPRSLPPPA